jgi:hypothetical protein
MGRRVEVAARIAAVSALIGCSKRLALSAFCGFNGRRLTLASDEAGTYSQ